jgi:hypothetical protein
VIRRRLFENLGPEKTQKIVASTLPQFQHTRGTLAKLAQWISKAVEDGYRRARREPLITLGSAPLDVPSFVASCWDDSASRGSWRPSTRTSPANDPTPAPSTPSPLGVLRDIHRCVGTTILFESSGGHIRQVRALRDDGSAIRAILQQKRIARGDGA